MTELPLEHPSTDVQRLPHPFILVASSGLTVMASGRRLQSSQIPSSQISPRQSVSLIREDLTGVPLDAIALIIENRFGIPFVLPPSPNTHPLQNKPQARNEQVHGPLASGKTSTRSSAKDSVLAVARQKATLFNVSSTPNQILRSGSRLSTDSCASIATPALAYRKGLREREGKAIEVAAEVGDVQEWGYYLKYYSEVWCFPSYFSCNLPIPSRR